MSALEAKITITAVDRVSDVVKGISKSLDSIAKSSSNLTNAWNRASNAGSDFVSRIRNLSLIAIGAGAAIFGLTQHYADYAHELTLSSIRTGIGVESLQKLQYAASLSGVQVDNLNVSLKFLNRSISVGSSNPVSQQAAAFNSMGISLKDANGNLKDANTVLLEISDRFKKSTSAAKETATAMAIFGRQGATLIPFLKEGSEHIKAFEEELGKLGHVWTPDELKQGQLFEESYIKLKAAISGVASVIAINLFPVIKPLIDAMTKWIVVNKIWLSDNIKQEVILFGQSLKVVWQYLKNIKDAVLPVINAFGGLKNIVGFLIGLYIARLVISFANLIGALFSLAKAFSLVSWAILASPITWIIGGVVLLGVAIYELIKHWAQVKAFMISIWPDVQPYFEAFMNFVTLGMYSVVKSIISHWSQVSPYLVKTWNFLASNAVYYFDVIYNAVAKAFAPIMPYVKAVWDGIKDYFIAILNDILGVFGTNLDAVENKIQSVIDSMKATLTEFADYIEAPFKKLYSIFSNVFNKIVSIKNAITGGSEPTIDSNGDAVNQQSGLTKAANVVKPLVLNSLGLNHQTNSVSSGTSLTQQAQNIIPLGQNQRIDINMQIDYEGRPTKVTAKSPSPINFNANVGKMI